MSVQNQITEAYNTLLETTKEVNEKVLATGEEVLNNVKEVSEQWQTLGKKAINGGVELAGKQQDILLDALETAKGQLTESTERFKNIVGIK